MIIKFHKEFTKKYKKLPSGVKNKLKERFFLFNKDKFHPLLNNHALTGKYFGYRSINITGDIRAVYKEEKENTVLFIIIDSHSNLYG